MTREEYIKEFKKFTLLDQQEIMTALMPDFCQIMMSEVLEFDFAALAASC